MPEVPACLLVVDALIIEVMICTTLQAIDGNIYRRTTQVSRRKRINNFVSKER